MRTLLWSPVAIAVGILVGIAICRIASLDTHLHDMTLAAGVCLIAGELAAVPILVARRATQAGMSQAGLAATVIHLLLSLALGAGANSAAHPSNAYLYWLLAFFWLTLIAVSIAGIRAIRHAPVSSPATSTGVK